MIESTLFSKSLMETFIAIDFQMPLRKMVGELISSTQKNSSLLGVAVRLVTDNGIPFFIYTNEDGDWAYFEGEEDIPQDIENVVSKDKRSILLDGNTKGEVYLSNNKSDENDILLKFLSDIVKKKLIFDRDSILKERQVVEKILRKGNHDIRSPFFGVSGFAQLIKQKSDDQEVVGYCQTMLESLERVESVMTELVSGLGDKQLRMKPQLFSLSEMVTDIAEKSKEMYSRCNILLDFSMEGDFYVSADKDLIKNAIYGVLNNSREELINGGEINITIKLAENGQNIELSIKDSGNGIPADILDSVFMPIYKYNKGDDHLGLGLSNSLNIIKSHGGNIRIKNNRKKNTEFVIDLPLAEKED